MMTKFVIMYRKSILLFALLSLCAVAFGQTGYVVITDYVKAGTGIGIENLKRRLELIYPGKYEYLTEASDGKYCATIILKGIC